MVLIHGFIDYCALLFMKGALLKDEKGVLIHQTENAQDRRQLRLTHLAEREELSETTVSYVLEAIEIEKAGLKVSLKKTDEFAMPGELQLLLDEMTRVETAMYGLTQGHQHGYVRHFSAAKKAGTPERGFKNSARNTGGKGWDD